MKKEKYKRNGENILCYYVTNDEFLREKGVIAGLEKECIRKEAELRVIDRGQEGYALELVLPQKTLFRRNANKYKNSNSNKVEAMNNDYER